MIGYDTKYGESKFVDNINSDRSSDFELGRRIYNFRCYFCHGYSGNAKTLASSFLSPAPRDFTSTSPTQLSKNAMIDAVTNGRSDTAMMPFKTILKENEIAAVVEFIRQEFMISKKLNTAYHTPENGWFGLDRYVSAFPFARGEIPLDTPWRDLTEEQQNGKRLFMSSCITCHDRSKVKSEGAIWELHPLSYPRNNYSNTATKSLNTDTDSGASPYLVHEVPPKIVGLSEQEQIGEKLFQNNCGFCHGADGTGRNWIGSFLQPHPRDLTGKKMSAITHQQLRQVIMNGLPGTTMSAWKSVLTDEQIESIIAYVKKVFINKYKSGQ